MPRPFFSGNGVAKRLLVALIAFSSIVTTVITAAELYVEYRRDLRGIESAFDFIRASSVPSLSRSVWQLDEDLVRSQLNGLLRMPDIEFVAVEENGKMRWSAGRVVSQRQLENGFALTYGEGKSSETIGRLRVVASVDHAIARVWDRAWAAVLGNGIKTLLVAGFLLLVFQFLVTKHLFKVAQFVREIDPRHQAPTERRLELDRPASRRWGPDILDDVAEAINGLLHSLRQAQTDLRASHVRLADSELRFRLGMEAAAAGLWDCDLVGKTLLVNAEGARILGEPASEMRSTLDRWQDRVHPDDLAPALAAVRHHLEQATSHLHLLCRLRHAQSGWRWISLRGRVVERGANGEALRAVGTLVDFDERKRAEGALQDREEKFRGIAEMNIDMIFQTDVEGRLRYVSPIVESLFELSPDEMTGRPFVEHVAPEHRAEATQLLARVLAGETLRHIELVALRKNGSRFPFEANATAIRIDDRIVGAQGVLRDITERRRAEEALRKNEARLRALTAHTSSLIYELDRDGRVTFANRGDEPPGRPVVGTLAVDWFEPARRPMFDAYLRKALAEGTRQSFEASFTDQTKGRRHYMVTIAPIQATDTTTVALTALDVTELKQAEEAMRDANQRLESRVTERTAAMQEARDEAQRANSAKSDFLSRMSHELRTPLNGILGFAELLQGDKPLTERQARGLRIIHESGQHLLTLINDILDLARIDAAKLDLVPIAIDLPSFLGMVADMVRVPAEHKGLLFSLERADDLPRTVSVDEMRLRQVLLNLLSNAIKFTDRGTVTLRVCLAASDPALAAAGAPTRRVRFEVQDSGIGMTPEQLGRIFQPFEQVSEARRRQGGTGLGLAISRPLVRLMGGDVQVQSDPGLGSRFSFELDMPCSEDAITRAMPQPEPVGYEGPRQKVLVVDDVALNRAFLVESLGAIGFDVCEAASGEDALESVRAEAPDLIVMDIMLPGIDGLETTRRIRAIAELAHVPVIATSASATREVEAASAEAGADIFIPKPIAQQQLLAATRRLLGLHWIYDESAAPAYPALVRGTDDGASLPPDELDVLYRLARIGNMRQICEQADYLQHLDPRHAPIAQRLRKLADACQSQAILSFVESLRDQDQESVSLPRNV